MYRPTTETLTLILPKERPKTSLVVHACRKSNIMTKQFSAQTVYIGFILNVMAFLLKNISFVCREIVITLNLLKMKNGFA